MQSKSEFVYLTVIIRDDAQLIHCGDSPTYRRVTMKLTDDQISEIKLFSTCKSMGNDVYESISSCFLEKQINDH